MASSQNSVPTISICTPHVAEHNAFLQTFHQSLMKDPAFLELIQGPGKAEASKSSGIVKTLLEDSVAENISSEQQGINEEECRSLVLIPVDVSGIEACLMSKSKEALLLAIPRLVPLWTACKAALHRGALKTGTEDCEERMGMMHALQLLCITLRCLFKKQVVPEDILKGFETSSGQKGAEFFRSVIGTCSLLLSSDGVANFTSTLALKLLNVLATSNPSVHEERVLQPLLIQEGVHLALLTAVSKSRLFRHCLSLDSLVLLLSLENHGSRRSPSQNGAEELGLDDPLMMQGVLESLGVIGDVAATRLLSSKYRKATVMEMLTNWSPIVLSEKECNTASAKDRELEIDQERRVESAALGQDGLPICFGTYVTILSLLLDRPQGPRVTQARLMLLSLLALVEDLKFAEAIHANPMDPTAEYTIFSREHASSVSAQAGASGARPSGKASRELRQTGAGLPPVCALSEVLVAFLSNNIRLALEVDLYLIALSTLHRLLCYQKNWRQGPALIDCKQVWDVALRLLTYISRPAVSKVGGPALRRLATVACQIVNLLLAHGAGFMGPLESETKDKQAVGAKDGRLLEPLEAAKDFVVLCYEVGRVGGSNKVFEKLLAQVDTFGLPQDPVEPAQDGVVPQGGAVGGGDLKAELEMARQCGEYINSSVETWLAAQPPPCSPTMPQILGVVGKAAAGMPLPGREDLVNFENFIEGAPEAALFREHRGELSEEYCRCIHVLPSNSAKDDA